MFGMDELPGFFREVGVGLRDGDSFVNDNSSWGVTFFTTRNG
jgi:hypothetical protein